MAVRLAEKPALKSAGGAAECGRSEEVFCRPYRDFSWRTSSPQAHAQGYFLPALHAIVSQPEGCCLSHKPVGLLGLLTSNLTEIKAGEIPEQSEQYVPNQAFL